MTVPAQLLEGEGRRLLEAAIRDGVAAHLETSRETLVAEIAVSAVVGSEVLMSTDGTGAPLEASITAWVMDWGDGTERARGAGSPPRRLQHVYAAPGRFSVVLMVTDETGASAEASAVVTLAAPAPAGDGDAPTAGAVLGGEDDGATAKAAVVAGILAAFGRFSDRQRPKDRSVVARVARRTEPGLSSEAINGIVDDEDASARAYEAKARSRLEDALETAMTLPPDGRAAAIERAIATERRIVRSRAKAVQGRAAGRAAAAEVRRQSPAGALWVLHPELDHCETCRALAGRVWSWDVLALVFPPLHPNCHCRLVAVAQAVAAGMVAPGVTPLDLRHVPDLGRLGRGRTLTGAPA